jgi:hypothetical protein
MIATPSACSCSNIWAKLGVATLGMLGGMGLAALFEAV